MKDKKHVSRRKFLKQSSLGVGLGVTGTSISSAAMNADRGREKLPREVCVASVDLRGLWPDKTTESRLKRIFRRMESVAGLQPDIICLPELFNTIWVDEKKPLAEIAEDEQVPGPVTSKIAKFARKHNCYVVCPVATKKDGNFYNSSMLVNRKGEVVGVYHKIHPTKTEVLPDTAFKGGGMTPGALEQPVIETDFGKVGMQICYDANWQNSWYSLRDKGAEIVFFSSAFPGGKMLNFYAWSGHYYIVSSTGQDARVVDISGNDIDSSSTFVRYAWAYINLEKVAVATWPTNGKLPDMFSTYGKRLDIKVWDNTGVITIESRDPMLKVMDVLEEFEIPTLEAHLKNTKEYQDRYRL
jgi:predicted amidohydrolase